MKAVNIFFILLIINKSFCLSRGLYYRKKKCFYDNFYANMNIVITYKILEKDLKINKSIKAVFQISLEAIKKNIFKSFYASKLSGKFSYNIEESDKYKICIYSADKELFLNKTFLHVKFKIQSSDELIDKHSAKAKDFEKINITMQKMNSKVDSIENMQNYQMEIEDNFSRNQIQSSSLLAFITILQIVIISIIGIYHAFSLRKIFKNKIWSPF